MEEQRKPHETKAPAPSGGVERSRAVRACGERANEAEAQEGESVDVWWTMMRVMVRHEVA